jgi:hypothetical protein
LAAPAAHAIPFAGAYETAITTTTKREDMPLMERFEQSIFFSFWAQASVRTIHRFLQRNEQFTGANTPDKAQIGTN